MKKIKKVKIDGFWGEKSVILNLNKDINFLIGPNGSGKTTIINLVAASLSADFTTLDKFQFDKIKIDFYENNSTENVYIEVEKVISETSSYPEIIFKIKDSDSKKIKTFNLNEIEEESLFRYSNELYLQRGMRKGQVLRDINSALKNIVSITWLSINRKNKFNKENDNNLDSTIDQKIKELSIDFAKYFGIIDKRYSIETEKFQKNIFLSLIREDSDKVRLVETSDLNSDKEKKALKEIFELFGLRENEFKVDLSQHFKAFDTAKEKLEDPKFNIDLNDFAAIIGTRRIHNIVQEWSALNDKKKDLNKPKFTFIAIINSLFQRKEIFINEKNELLIETQSGKIFPLSHLSSGEKQLLILLGQNLLQEEASHIYIADEPELSLHVEWQEKLVDSMRSINNNSQIIFATHSPDIVGKYSGAIIQVENIIQ